MTIELEKQLRDLQKELAEVQMEQAALRLQPCRGDSEIREKDAKFDDLDRRATIIKKTIVDPARKLQLLIPNPPQEKAVILTPPRTLYSAIWIPWRNRSLPYKTASKVIATFVLPPALKIKELEGYFRIFPGSSLSRAWFLGGAASRALFPFRDWPGSLSYWPDRSFP